MFIVDAHLDLACNALAGRDVLVAADKQVGKEYTPSVGLPDLRAGSVGLICATLFTGPWTAESNDGYRTPQEAHDSAMAQLRWYQTQADAGEFRIVRSKSDLPSVNGKVENQKIPTIILMENGDPIRHSDDAHMFFNAGVRLIGLAWRGTRYAGGTGEPGPLTEEGRQIVPVLDSLGIIHDASHLAEQSFWDLLEISGGPIMASHSNCRALVPTDRQLSDEMIKAIEARKGVIGINFYDRFLIPSSEGKRRAMLADIVTHIKHMSDLLGSTAGIGFGTDMDGGFGREQIPQEIRTSADLPRVADALSSAGYSDADVMGVMGGNFVRFFTENLPLR